VLAYRLGQACFLRLFIEERHEQTGADELDGATTMRAVEQVSEYIDRVVGRVLPLYEQECTGWLQNAAPCSSAACNQCSTGEPIDIDRLQPTLGYRLRQHLGLVL
jgi:hypothetical protein